MDEKQGWVHQKQCRESLERAVCVGMEVSGRNAGRDRGQVY